MTRPSDAEIAQLVKRCRAGDEAAWSQLVRRITPVILSICKTMKLSREESFDVFGQVIYLLLVNLDKLRSPDKLLAYVGTTTRREIYSVNRREKLFEYIVDTELRLKTDSVYPGPDKTYEQSKRRETLSRAMFKLPQRDYQLLRILFFDSRKPDYEAASDLLGMPVGSVGPTRARILAKLKRILEKEGFEFE